MIADLSRLSLVIDIRLAWPHNVAHHSAHDGLAGLHCIDTRRSAAFRMGKKRAKKPFALGSLDGLTKSKGTSPSDNDDFPSHASEHARHLRLFIGSLVDSFSFKENGLVKKTISIKYRNVLHRIISYYSVEDVIQGKLPTPSRDQAFRDLIPRAELTTSQKFRVSSDRIKRSSKELLATDTNLGEFVGYSNVCPGINRYPLQLTSATSYNSPQGAPPAFYHSHEPLHDGQLTQAVSVVSPTLQPLPSSTLLPVSTSMHVPSSEGVFFAPHLQVHNAHSLHDLETRGGSELSYGGDYFLEMYPPQLQCLGVLVGGNGSAYPYGNYECGQWLGC
ncbi:hypothetical protein Purlil1_13747 [Purpureocillium lilacinum]|uniref:Uncharacterized protein n=1 Tax=Purpureocillium lilacinum TaxID=33203 RepID=A0ABR0BDW0_PURLI|nr:hypothetical protein Purlil1_13747 [Purpureocillium lilacinum]